MTSPRYANIDGLRAIAALCVMVEHLFGDMLRQAPSASGPFRDMALWVVQSVSLGRFGVALFFLISGFVVPFSIRGERPLAHFAVSRLLRLYPAMWLALALITGLSWLDGDPPRTGTVLANLTMAPTLFGRPWLSPIYWTLFVELVFYVGAGLLFALGRMRHVGVLFGLSLLLVAATVLPVLARIHGGPTLPVQYVGLHLSFLVLGLLLRLAMIEGERGAWPAALGVMAAQGLAVLAVAEFSLARGDAFIVEGRVPVLAAYALAALAFVAAVLSGRPRVPWLGRIGLISYGMYLFHGIVNALVYRLVPLTGQAGDAATMLACIALTLAVSAASYRLVERPMMEVGRRRLGPRTASDR